MTEAHRPMMRNSRYYNMRNMIPIFIIPYIVLASIVILYVYLNVLKKKRVKPEEEIESL